MYCSDGFCKMSIRMNQQGANGLDTKKGRYIASNHDTAKLTVARDCQRSWFIITKRANSQQGQECYTILFWSIRVWLDALINFHSTHGTVSMQKQFSNLLPFTAVWVNASCTTFQVQVLRLPVDMWCPVPVAGR